MAPTADYAAVLSRLDVVSDGPPWTARCPNKSGHKHGDRNPSLRLWVSDQGNLCAKCYAGCSWQEVNAALGLSGKEWFPGAEGDKVVKPRPIDAGYEAIYDYRDEAGDLLFQVCRKRLAGGGKTFTQRRPIPECPNEWAYSLAAGWYRGEHGCYWSYHSKPCEHAIELPAVRIVPFRLPELVKNPGWPVIVCYTPDTEILTTAGWVPFPDLTKEHRVAQYRRDDGGVDFVHPLAVQRFPYSGELVGFDCDFCDLAVTPDHRMLVGRYGRDRRTFSTKVVAAGELNYGNSLPVSGMASGDGGPTVDEARLLAAYAADGHLPTRGLQISWNIKKERKKSRLRDLLMRAGVAWSEFEYESTPSWTQIVIQRDHATFLQHYFPDKQIHLGCMGWAPETRLAFMQELGHWDGDFNGSRGIRFFTAKKSEADAVAALAAITGFGCILRTDNRANRPDQGPQYILNLVPTGWRCLGKKTTRIEGYSGEVFCCTVPSGFVVVRRNGRTTIAGNCEGEKDVLMLATLFAGKPLCFTSSPMGAGKWRPEFGEFLRGRQVAVLPDNDPQGFAHACMVAGSALAHGAESIRVVRWPDGIAEGADVTDWLQEYYANATPAERRAAVAALIRSAKAWSKIES